MCTLGDDTRTATKLGAGEMSSFSVAPVAAATVIGAWSKFAFLPE